MNSGDALCNYCCGGLGWLGLPVSFVVAGPGPDRFAAGSIHLLTARLIGPLGPFGKLTASSMRPLDQQVCPMFTGRIGVYLRYESPPGPVATPGRSV